ncbi:LysR substrate-binding domain-containing protein [Piscirickettsia litoralis]|uniref:LysR substrate-binding domain-containing protein n=1 Tax=Piscirickettsia litoralis TaxID=1891921 RepID=A0ABX3A4F4_9GAMM|nr:LysR substrate-binding domain-containing protein [Piscirickettsia litoralis]ODN42310.1 hypothetical protein BGC07_04395 [Piscirickettsia litoralis]
MDHYDNRHGGWWLQNEGERFLQPIQLTHTTNSSLALRQMAIAGLGVVYLPSFTVRSAIKQGELIRILLNYEPQSLPMYAVSLQPWRQQTKLIFLLEWLKEVLQGAILS